MKTDGTRKKKNFRFEEMWTRDGSCGEVIKEAWGGGYDMASCMARTTAKLWDWSKAHFGEFAKEMRACQSQMCALMSEEQTHHVIDNMKEFNARMDQLKRREEVYWRQRSRQDWLRSRDQNTKFFHAKTKQRRERNSIGKIRDGAGNEFYEEDEISEVLVQHFDELFRANDIVDAAPVIDKVCARVTPELQSMPAEPYVTTEVQEALKQMHPTKAPGPDDMCALFHRKFWNVVGIDVKHTILDILNNGGDVTAFNHTNIALIPKKKICESPVDYRPISLCNVIYKLVSKVLANRLKRVLPLIIHESQSGFVRVD